MCTSVLFFILFTASNAEAITLWTGIGDYSQGTSPSFGLSYSSNFTPNFTVESSMEYWFKSRKIEESRRVRSCNFSDLFFNETALFKTHFLKNVTLKIGAGFSIHLLKNTVADKTEYPSFIITEYYTLSDNKIGLHTQSGIDFHIAKTVDISSMIRYTIILNQEGEYNLFYDFGRIKSYYLLMGIAYNW